MIFRPLSLSKKVMLLVAVPLVLELGFIGILGSALSQVEQERRAANHAHDVATALNVFLRMTMDALVSSVLFYFSRDDGIWHRSEDTSKRIKQQIDVIEQICAGHPQELAVINGLKVHAKDGERRVQNARDALRNGDRATAVEEWGELKKSFKDLNEKTQELVDVELLIEKDRGAAVERYERQVGVILAVG